VAGGGNPSGSAIRASAKSSLRCRRHAVGLKWCPRHRARHAVDNHAGEGSGPDKASAFEIHPRSPPGPVSRHCVAQKKRRCGLDSDGGLISALSRKRGRAGFPCDTRGAARRGGESLSRTGAGTAFRGVLEIRRLFPWHKMNSAMELSGCTHQICVRETARRPA